MHAQACRASGVCGSLDWSRRAASACPVPRMLSALTRKRRRCTCACKPSAQRASRSASPTPAKPRMSGAAASRQRAVRAQTASGARVHRSCMQGHSERASNSERGGAGRWRDMPCLLIPLDSRLLRFGSFDSRCRSAIIFSSLAFSVDLRSHGTQRMLVGRHGGVMVRSGCW